MPTRIAIYIYNITHSIHIFLNWEVTSVGEDVKKLEPSYITSWNIKWCSLYGKNFVGFSELNIEFSNDPEILLLGKYEKELKTGIQTKTGKWIFIIALFITAEKVKCISGYSNVYQLVNGQNKCVKSKQWTTFPP